MGDPIADETEWFKSLVDGSVKLDGPKRSFESIEALMQGELGELIDRGEPLTMLCHTRMVDEVSPWSARLTELNIAVAYSAWGNPNAVVFVRGHTLNLDDFRPGPVAVG